MDIEEINNTKLMQIRRVWESGKTLTVDEIDFLLSEVKRLKQFQHEYVCRRCGIRQNSLPPSDFPAF